MQSSDWLIVVINRTVSCLQANNSLINVLLLMRIQSMNSMMVWLLLSIGSIQERFKREKRIMNVAFKI